MPLTLDELAIRIPASIQLFEKYGLDYYQKGAQTLREACESGNVPFAELDSELARLEEVTLTLADLSADRLIDHLNGQYHSGEKELLQSIHASIRQLIKSSEREYRNKLRRIEPVFRKLKLLLTEHCEKEDELFFPWMRKLTALHRNKTLESVTVIIGFIKNPVNMLETDHKEIIGLLELIKKKAGNFSQEEHAPAGYNQLMQDFKAFEADLHMHLHIENNILFPKLVLLEEALVKPLNL